MNTLKGIVKLASEGQFVFEDIDILGVNRNGELYEFASLDEVIDYIDQHPVEYSPEEISLLRKIESIVGRTLGILARRVFALHSMLCMSCSMPKLLLRCLHRGY